MESDETVDADVEIDDDEIDQAEIEEIRQHARNPLAPRSVLHLFASETREAAQRCADALNEKYGPTGGAASVGGAALDLTDPEIDLLGHVPFQVAFEHEAVVDNAYLDTIHDIEAIAQASGVSYSGWQADEDEGFV